jgi:hypothetical protein
LRSPSNLIGARLAFNEFLTLYDLKKPDFGLFVSSAVATTLHTGINLYLNARKRGKSQAATRVSLALDELDAEVGMLLAVAAQEQATLVVTSGYGQVQVTNDKDSESEQRFWLLLKPHKLITWLRVDHCIQMLPSMLPCATLRFRSDADRNKTVKRLNQLRRVGDDAPMFYIEEGICCISLKAMPDEVSMRSGLVSYREPSGARSSLPISQLGLVERKRQKLEGEHRPGGVLLVHRPEFRGATWLADVGIAAIAPTLIELLGAKAPPSMHSPALGFLQKFRDWSRKV